MTLYLNPLTFLMIQGRHPLSARSLPAIRSRRMESSSAKAQVRSFSSRLLPLGAMVIRSMASSELGVNHDGRTNGITAPSVGAQTALLSGVYQRFGIDPATISLVEAHGTGTPLGDPIEVAALTAAFRRFTDQRGFCAIGSVKGNIGHTTGAAGVAGLIKVLLSLRHGTICPTLHAEEENERIDFASTPFYVSREARAWPRGDTPRRAAVSSFGFSGTNCHVIVEEAPAEASMCPASMPLHVPLSARTDERLRATAARLAAFVRSEPRRSMPSPKRFPRASRWTRGARSSAPQPASYRNNSKRSPRVAHSRWPMCRRSPAALVHADPSADVSFCPRPLLARGGPPPSRLIRQSASFCSRSGSPTPPQLHSYRRR